MSIDTLAKRNSVLIVSTNLLPIPDSTIDAGDRQTLLKRYSGILSGAAIEVLSKAIQTIAIRIGVSI